MFLHTRNAFQSTHPCGVRQPVTYNVEFSDVSIHAPVWGATAIDHEFGNLVSFNPRTRVGCDNQIAHNTAQLTVSIHAPVWGATLTTWLSVVDLAFQSTHPCGVRPLGVGATSTITPVSIHAPVWGATYATALFTSSKLFQSTHPCGVRQTMRKQFDRAAAFQSTHPCGVRLAAVSRTRSSVDVSIHAPVWGATTPFKIRFE